jgi:hypothetical protein
MENVLMNAKHFTFALAMALSYLPSTWANGPGGPVSATEMITTTVVVGQPIDLFFPNHFDLHHPKKLIFEGVFTNTNPNQGSAGDFWFDWLDPLDPTGAVKTSPPIPIDIAAGGSVAVGVPGATRPALMWEIPFCPPQVSIHYHIGSGGPVVVDGKFTHICRIPEPNSMLLAALGLAGVGVVALRRRRS